MELGTQFMTGTEQASHIQASHIEVTNL